MAKRFIAFTATFMLVVFIFASPLFAEEKVVVGPNGPTLEQVEVSKKEPTPKEVKCAKRWKWINRAAGAADLASTIAFLETNRGEEQNPIVRALFGKTPKWYEVTGYKVGTTVLTELFAGSIQRGGNYKAACTVYKTSAILSGGIAALNLRLLF